MNLLIFITIFLVIIKTVTFHYLHNSNNLIISVKDSTVFIPKILIQQILLFLTWSLTTSLFSNLLIESLIIAILFSSAHFYLLKKLRLNDALLIIVASFIGGLIFTYLYSNYFLGLWIAFIIHLAFHTFLDIIYFILGIGPMKKRI